jgi:hypothetical protein
MTTARVFGRNEAAAMFETLYSALADTTTIAEVVVTDLLAERELLLEHRDALSKLLRAVGTENFNRTGKREMSTSLRAAIRQAEEVLS